MSRRHYRDEGTVAVCGYWLVEMTEDIGEVTCKLCKRVLAKRIAKEREGFRDVGWEEAIRSLAHVLAGPPVLPYPTLTPDRFRSMRCRFGRPCRCDWCIADEGNVKIRAQWEAESQARPHQRHERPFGSVRSALASLHRSTGGAASSMGSALSRLRETAALGTHVQTTQRHDRDPLELRRVDQAVDVERGIRWAFREEQARRGLSLEACAAILTDAVVEDGHTPDEWAERLGVSVPVVRGVIAHGLRTVGAWLYLAEYVPEPRKTETVDRVRAAMARGAKSWVTGDE